jgi:hypothetical protein
MTYISKAKFDGYKQCLNDGTKDNPYIYGVDDNYKLAIYLGYLLKWDYDYEYSNKDNSYFYYLKPYFKKSYNRFEFSYAFYKGKDDYYPYSVGYSWDFIIDEVLPKMKADGLYNNSINEALINLDKITTFKEFMVVLNKKIKK